MGSIVLTLKSESPQADLQQKFQLESGKPKEQARAVSEMFRALAGGIRAGSLDVATGSADPLSAAATVTITHANVTNADTTTILGVVITAATSGNGTTSWTIGASATADAAAFAACVNANTTLSKYLAATSALGVVTLTVKQKGSLGNLLAALATSDATAFAFVQWAGGTGGAEETAVTYSLGL